MSDAEVSVFKGAERFELADQVRITPAPKLCGASNRFLRCLSIRPGTSLLTDIDTASHVIERRIEKLPLMHRLWFHPSGYCLGYRKSGRIGNPSDLFFLNPAGLLLQSFQLADAVSEVEADLGLWYVGCRDSRFQVVIAGGSRDCITAVGIAAHQIAVGTQDGKLELFNGEGTLLGAFRIGDAPVSVISMDHCQLRASYAGGLLTMFDNRRITGFVILPAYFATLAPCGSEIVVWSGKEAWVVDRKGRVVWRAAFKRRIRSVVVGQVGLHVLAGELFWFQRTAEEDPTAGGEQERGGWRKTAQHPDPEAEFSAPAGRKPRLAGPAEKSKAARVLAMLARPEGASVKEIQSVTAWQPHTLRAFVSGTARKRLGLPVISERRPDGERIYRLTQGGSGPLG